MFFGWFLETYSEGSKMNHERIWTIAEIKDLLDRNDKMVCRSLVQMYNKQTEAEKVQLETHDNNKVGFNAYDARFGTAMALLVKEGKELSPKQIEASRKMLTKYARQLMLVANKAI